MEIGEQKSAARKAAFVTRRLAHAQGLGQRACDHLMAHLSTLPGVACIAAYMPIRTEVDPLPVMHDLHKRGIVVSVPVIQGACRPLLFSRWCPGAPMAAGPFGALVPETADYVRPDILITPLVAFDARGYRLGYGGGFYDRTFAELRHEKPAQAIGFAYGAQEIPVVPVEPTDIRLDAIVTERGILTF